MKYGALKVFDCNPVGAQLTLPNPVFECAWVVGPHASAEKMRPVDVDR